MDIKIYVAAHRPFAVPDVEPIYVPLQVGCEGKKSLGYLADNTGQNISEKNANYCELTGMYWIWKNSTADIVGLCHYRRYLAHGRKILTREHIEETMRQYDMILPDSSMSKVENAYTHYCDRHHKQDLDCCLEVIRERCPEYVQAFLWTLSSDLISIGNIMIAHKQVFDQYCTWLFDILFEAERRINFKEYDAYQSRVFGFLSERLLRVWVMMQKLRILEEEVLYLETAVK